MGDIIYGWPLMFYDIQGQFTPGIPKYIFN